MNSPFGSSKPWKKNVPIPAPTVTVQDHLQHRSNHIKMDLPNSDLPVVPTCSHFHTSPSSFVNLLEIASTPQLAKHTRHLAIRQGISRSNCHKKTGEAISSIIPGHLGPLDLSLFSNLNLIQCPQWKRLAKSGSGQSHQTGAICPLRHI